MEHLAPLLGYTVVGKQEALGTLSDIYIYEENWSVRYFVVDHGGWLDGQSTLIPPTAVLDGADPRKEVFSIRFSKSHLDKAPDASEQLTVSEELSREIASTYGWYEPLVNTKLYRFITSRLVIDEIKEEVESNLRSMKELFNYSVELQDGEKGVLADFLVDHDSENEPWRIRKFVAEVSASEGEEARVLVPVEEIGSLKWIDKNVVLEN